MTLQRRRLQISMIARQQLCFGRRRGSPIKHFIQSATRSTKARTGLCLDLHRLLSCDL
jgi:hypothetical protein